MVPRPYGPADLGLSAMPAASAEPREKKRAAPMGTALAARLDSPRRRGNMPAYFFCFLRKQTVQTLSPLAMVPRRSNSKVSKDSAILLSPSMAMSQ